MSLNESIVEDAALKWFGELGYAFGHEPHLAPCEPASRDGGRDSFGEVVLVGRLREAIRRLNAANACGNPHPASPTGRGEEASPVRCTQTGGQSLQILQQFKPEWR